MEGYRFKASDEVVVEVEPEEQQGLFLTKEREEKISRFMSKLLRHDKKGGLLRCDGFASCDDMMRLVKCTQGEMEQVVTRNGKQRFCFGEGVDSGKRYVRANQGHSVVGVDVSMEILNEDDVVNMEAIHGTSVEASHVIMKEGLSRMNRLHIHMAQGRNYKCGLRSSCQVLIGVNMKQAMMDGGIVFLRSKNGVLLSPGNQHGIIPPKYLKLLEK